MSYTRTVGRFLTPRLSAVMIIHFSLLLLIVVSVDATSTSTPRSSRRRLLLFGRRGHHNKVNPEALVYPKSPPPQNGTATNPIPEWKKSLPEPLNNKTKTLQRLTIPGPSGRSIDVYLLGTAHVSNDSSRDVQLLLESINPDVIFLELCDQRVPLLLSSSPPDNNTTDTAGSQQKTKKPRATSLYTAAASMLTNMQQDYADSLGVELGGEFRVAHDYWDAQHEEERIRQTRRRKVLVLGDRPLYLTLNRAWESLGVWGKTKLIIGLLISSLQKPNPDEIREWMESILQDDSGDLLSKSIAELAKHFPTLEEVIIRERDAYMACKLYQTCRQLMTISNGAYTIVAIVGAGHVDGICNWLTIGNGQAPEQILQHVIQTKKSISEEDQRVLIHDVLEVDRNYIQQIATEGYA